MATVYKCDKCGTQSPHQDTLIKVKTEGWGYYDLCGACIKRFQDWLKVRG